MLSVSDIFIKKSPIMQFFLLLIVLQILVARINLESGGQRSSRNKSQPVNPQLARGPLLVATFGTPSKVCTSSWPLVTKTFNGTL